MFLYLEWILSFKVNYLKNLKIFYFKVDFLQFMSLNFQTLKFFATSLIVYEIFNL